MQTFKLFQVENFGKGKQQPSDTLRIFKLSRVGWVASALVSVNFKVIVSLSKSKDDSILSLTGLWLVYFVHLS